MANSDRARRPADRGYGEASVEDNLDEFGVRSVAIHRKSKRVAARREFEH